VAVDVLVRVVLPGLVPVTFTVILLPFWAAASLRVLPRAPAMALPLASHW
jgi:hypothetical protein